jgi:hypothetical protein
MSDITITVSGPVGAGKSAICAKLEILLKHAGLQVEWEGGVLEKNLNIEDWDATLGMYGPTVKIKEVIERAVPSGDQLRAIIKSVGSFGTNHSDAPQEYVLAGWIAAREAIAKPVVPLIPKDKIDVLISEHSEWTSQGYAIVDKHRQNFVQELLALIEYEKVPLEESGGTLDNDKRTDEKKITEGTCDTRLDTPIKQVFPVIGMPVGFMMKHMSGHDTGFSWNKSDPQFSQEWERIGLFSREQMAEAMRQMDREYNERAKKWRDAFEAMHRRAMNAEEKVDRLTHESAVFRAVLEGQEFNRLDELPNLENAVERARALGERAAQISKDVRKTLELVQQHFAPWN